MSLISAAVGSTAKLQKEFFAKYPPASTMVEVKALVDAEMLVEADAGEAEYRAIAALDSDINSIP